MFRWIMTKVFREYWNPYVAIGLAGIFSALFFGITGTVWAVTGEFTRLGGHLLQLFHVDVSQWAYFQMIKMQGTPLDRTDGWIVIGMLVGAMITVLLSNSFKIRVPRQKRRLIQGFIGGIIAGFGARLALGCNLAAFFTGVPQFSFHAWIFMVATAVGTYLGVKVVNTSWWRGKPNLQRVRMSAMNDQTKEKSPRYQTYLGILIAMIYLVILVSYIVKGKSLLAIAGLFGACFGIFIERGQICFTSAFRDLWLTGRAVMTKALAVGMMLSVVLTFIFIQSGAHALIKVAAPSTLIGGLLFGLGIVMAGGCETGMMYRAMEGQVHFWMVGLGNIVGATLLAYAWDHLGIYTALVKGWPAINLITEWGAPQALIGTLALLIVWYLFSSWWEKHYRFGKGLQVKGEKFVPQKLGQ
ncbi:hypothetical protein DNHGIG_03310 [Collibacillus ludicampi]|jgi:uncharacterized membrane protein YedE/YeeE|uniref:Selenium metabolism membrane protein YedE/FdhT n=1 Tax=Collibacillus ludicampi TaxID=2771369 RepID=A0AAV4LAE6_9BACL|nr:selenium metabolism membrane protein YedE/FdhT [Collibacillus ludicampi]GIM44782.1 hypothetical protein DNHGIG_03310 [Collibacillus ludicampi]